MRASFWATGSERRPRFVGRLRYSPFHERKANARNTRLERVGLRRTREGKTGCRPVARPPRLGRGNRGFESHHPDVSKPSKSHHQLHLVCERDRWRCRYCDRPLYCRACNAHSGAERGAIWATRDHILPRSKGGTGALANLAAACPPCNQQKADTIPAGYVQVIPPPPKSPRPRTHLTHRAVVPLRVIERLHSLDCWVTTFIALNPGTPVDVGAPWWCNCGSRGTE